MSVLVVVRHLENPMADCGLNEPLICDRKSKEGASVTQQSFAKDADINNIMSRYAKTGVLVNPLDPDSDRSPMFMDVSGIGDFQQVQDRVQAIGAAFMTLPAAVRARFHNAPAEAIDFIADARNLKESVELGLLPRELLPKEEGAPAKPEPTPPAAAS